MVTFAALIAMVLSYYSMTLAWGLEVKSWPWFVVFAGLVLVMRLFVDWAERRKR